MYIGDYSMKYCKERNNAQIMRILVGGRTYAGNIPNQTVGFFLFAFITFSSDLPLSRA